MNPLVSASWVASRLENENTVVLDATLPPVGGTPPVNVRERYLEAHLPGAVFFDIEELSDHSTNLPHMLPAAEEFAGRMSRLGVGDDMTIIVYEQGDVFSAPRAWWMLRTLGAQHVYILDGGLREWTAQGLEVERGPVHRVSANFQAHLNQETVPDFSAIQRLIELRGQILDARSAGRFTGTSPEPRPGIRSGHMPGATNVPYTALTQANRMKSEQELLAIFAENGVDLQRPITTSCGSGVTAAVIALGLEICGARDVKLYDGSWAEYAQRPEAIIEGASQSVK